MVIWELVTLGALPFGGLSNQSVLQVIFGGGRLQAPNGASDKLLVQNCSYGDDDVCQDIHPSDQSRLNDSL